MSAAIDPAAARVAAQWLVRLRDGALSTAEQQQFDAWRDGHPDHIEAWRRAELLCQTLTMVPPALRQQQPRGERRRAVKQLAMLIACTAPPLWLASRSPWWQSWCAGIVTGTGEIRQLPLPDGTQLALNSATAIDIAYDDKTRLIVLHAGEIHLRSAADPAKVARPLLVRSGSGSVRTLGTRFAVREEGSLFSPRTHVCVMAGAVEIVPSQAPHAARTIHSGWQTSFDANAVASVAAAPANSEAWLQGVLIAERMPLGEVLAQLARYRKGVVRCDPAVARLPVDGIFQLNDTDRILALLQVSLPIRIVLHTPYWVSIGPA
ncbi:FecR domain-containing protein [Janthinobacterium sp. RB2R34]